MIEESDVSKKGVGCAVANLQKVHPSLGVNLSGGSLHIDFQCLAQDLFLAMQNCVHVKNDRFD